MEEEGRNRRSVPEWRETEDKGIHSELFENMDNNFECCDPSL